MLEFYLFVLRPSVENLFRFGVTSPRIERVFFERVNVVSKQTELHQVADDVTSFEVVSILDGNAALPDVFERHTLYRLLLP